MRNVSPSGPVASFGDTVLEDDLPVDGLFELITFFDASTAGMLTLIAILMVSPMSQAVQDGDADKKRCLIATGPTKFPAPLRSALTVYRLGRQTGLLPGSMSSAKDKKRILFFNCKSQWPDPGPTAAEIFHQQNPYASGIRQPIRLR